MRVYEAFETSERLISEGRECEIEFGGRVICKIWVRPADPVLNADYRRELAELAVGILRDGNVNEIDEDTDRLLLWKVYARSVILKIVWTAPDDKKDAKPKFNQDMTPAAREKNAIAFSQPGPKLFQRLQQRLVCRLGVLASS